jgi:hypothetical protein
LAVTLTVLAGDDRDLVFDFSPSPELVGGLTISSAEVLDAPSGVTLGAATVTTGIVDNVAAGKAVTVEFSGATAGTVYPFAVRVTLSNNRKVTISVRVVVAANT